MIKASIIFGTRPECIKIATLVSALMANEKFEINVCFTGQHKEMVLPLIDFFNLPVHCSLNIMTMDQSLASLTSKSVDSIDNYLKKVNPDIVFVQGDTTTAMSAAIAAFYRKIAIGHIEAGLRTFNIKSPFPEELNRQIISKLADLHFAPTVKSKENLLKEGVSSSNIFITGNTVVDALLYTREKINHSSNKYIPKIYENNSKRPYILITGHRRENFGDGFKNICNAILKLANKYEEFDFVYPVHLNPNVQQPVRQILSSTKNIFLIEPLDYVNFTSLLADCYFVITDSGGIQEEAPSFGKPVLVMRDATERNEAIEAGTAILVGTNVERILSSATTLIESEEEYKKMSLVKNPFGSGDAAFKIVENTLNYFDHI